MLDRQLLAAGASKTEHVVHLTLNPAQTFLYQALLKVWRSVDILSRVLYQGVLDLEMMPLVLPHLIFVCELLQEIGQHGRCMFAIFGMLGQVRGGCKRRL